LSFRIWFEIVQPLWRDDRLGKRADRQELPLLDV